MSQSSPVLIIAEAGVNHNGNLDLARQLITTASEAGADVVKFQTFTPSALVTSGASKARYQADTTGGGESQLEMLSKLALTHADFVGLAQFARQSRIDFVSTAFDLESLAFLLREIPMPFLKISSGDITYAPLLMAAAASEKPILLSSGASDLSDIENALGVLALGIIAPETRRPTRNDFSRARASSSGQQALLERVTLLHCTTEYPAPAADIHLRAMETLKSAFGLRVGYSDHSSGIAVSIAAVALGASVIEKHFTLDQNLPGPDHRASLNPDELKKMVEGIRTVEVALGSSQKRPSPSEVSNREIVRRSIVAARDIAVGEVLTEENTTCKRPGNGISALLYGEVLGKPSPYALKKDELVRI